MYYSAFYQKTSLIHRNLAGVLQNGQLKNADFFTVNRQ